jgi:hypothetical protein
MASCPYSLLASLKAASVFLAASRASDASFSSGWDNDDSLGKG